MNEQVPTKFCINCANFRSGRLAFDMCIRDVSTVTVISPVSGPMESQTVGFADSALRERTTGECGMEAKFFVQKEVKEPVIAPAVAPGQPALGTMIMRWCKWRGK